MIPQLTKIAEELKAGHLVEPVTVRTFLSWFDAQRRGYWIVANIRNQLKEAGVSTFPDFESAWVDAPIQFVMNEKPSEDNQNISSEENAGFQEDKTTGGADAVTWVSKDPTYRVSKLEAANQPIVSCNPDSAIAEVVTLLLSGGYSQLPVMTNEREVKGMITWKSIGSKMAMGSSDGAARHFMVPHHEIRADTSIFGAIPMIIANDYVLVRNQENNKITGIITANDLAEQFRLLTEPFLLLSEIENMIRNLIGSHFTTAELSAARDPASGSTSVSGVHELTFGEYIRLLQEPGRWRQLCLAIDRVIFCKNLDRVRQIRNGVTHFDPDGITKEDLEVLRSFTAFLKDIEAISKRG